VTEPTCVRGLSYLFSFMLALLKLPKALFPDYNLKDYVFVFTVLCLFAHFGKFVANMV